MLKVYLAKYDHYIGCNEWEEYELTVIANTKSEALGFALEYENTSQAKYWEIHEVDTSEAGVVYIEDL